MNPLIVCNQEHRFLVAEQMRDIKIKPQSILLEPCGRNTAPAITSLAIKANEKGENPILLVLPSDHDIKNEFNFEKAIHAALPFVNQDKLVTFGVTPTEAASGFGYIESENILSHEELNGEKIIRFIEKPSKEVAESFLLKNFYWNSGIFMFRANSFLKEIKKYSFDMFKLCSDALSKSVIDLDFQRLDKVAFSKCENISIDNALMEKTTSGYVLPLNVGWSDVGSWESMWKISKKDKNGNLIDGKIISKDVKNSYLRSESRSIVAIGLESLIVVETEDAILVANKSETQSIKKIVEDLKRNGNDEAIKHKKVYRPWGTYKSILIGKSWQVKELTIMQGHSISLQMHNHRTEHWIVVSGNALVEKEGEKFVLGQNESTYIPMKTKHRLSNIGKETLILIEVQSGDYLGEDDIIRFDDNYGRK